jgi:hypothetical protein
MAAGSLGQSLAARNGIWHLAPWQGPGQAGGGALCAAGRGSW